MPDVHRFAAAERAVHHVTAALLLTCLLTAMALYVAPVAQLVGRRHLVASVHEWSGLVLPVPFLLGLLSRALRADLRRLDRFDEHDRRWLSSLRKADPGRGRWAGKFNAGQKLWSAWIAGAVLVMLGTGLDMWLAVPLGGDPLDGGVIVHDALALAIGVVVAGHVGRALADRESLRAMLTGRVRRSWAHGEHRLWDVE